MTNDEWMLAYCLIGFATIIWIGLKHGWPDGPFGGSSAGFFYAWAIWPLLWLVFVWYWIKEARNK